MAAAAAASCFVQAGSLQGRQTVVIGNDQLVATVLCGGGHIALLQRRTDWQFCADNASAPEVVQADYCSPLWVPPWPTTDPAASSLADPAVFGEGLEGKYLLSHLMGHNLCLDVFGAHTEAETAHAGQLMSFHGEAGQVSWRVTGSSADDTEASMTLRAHLSATCLDVTRTFTVRKESAAIKAPHPLLSAAAHWPFMQVEETVTNLVGFQRALGRAQHVSFGKVFLGDQCTVFNTNAQLGHTMPGETEGDAAASASLPL